MAKKEFELTDLHRYILGYLEESDCPVVYAKEVGEMFDTTGQKASGALRSLENHGYLVGKKIGGGMHEMKIYYLRRM